jgi:hypothetical protein
MDTVTRAQVDAEIQQLTGELLDLAATYRTAKRRYARRRDHFRAGVNVEIQLRDDHLAQRAVSDCAWYGTDLERVAAALLALVAVAGRREPVEAEPVTVWGYTKGGAP